MRHSKHDIFPSHFSGLTKEESEKLEEDLLKHITQADGFESFEAMEKELLCPNCGGSHIVRRGYRGKAMTTRRYFCRECRKGFQISNGPIITDSRYGPERWKPFSLFRVAHGHIYLDRDVDDDEVKQFICEYGWDEETLDSPKFPGLLAEAVLESSATEYDTDGTYSTFEDAAKALGELIGVDVSQYL